MKASRRNRRRQNEKALSDRIRLLARSLAEIDRREPPEFYFEAASDEATADRRAAIGTLNKIQNFLRLQNITSSSLFRLIQDLDAVEHNGARPAMFTPTAKAGRKPDSGNVQYIKGSLAGMAYVQMQYGMSREQAAGWVARNVPSELARQISRKPISPSTVKEWMDEYGGTLRVRRRIISDGGLTEGPFFRPEIQSLVSREIQSNRMKGGNGEIGCLRMLGIGHLCLAAGAPLLHREIFTGLQEPFKTETPRKP